MAIEIFKLVGSIMVDNDKAKKSISDTGKTAEETGSKFDKLGDLAKKAAGVIEGTEKLNVFQVRLSTK